MAFDFGRIPILSQLPLRIQTKLTLSSPGDAAEQEADHVSEQVTRSALPTGSC